MRMLYMAHPVSGDVPGNLARAKRWLAYLFRHYKAAVVIAPWIIDIELGLTRDDDPAGRELGLRRDEAVVQRCDGIVLVGGRISDGMRREMARAADVIDLTGLGDEPPEEA